MTTPSLPEPIVERMVALRRDLHRHPELSWEERRTMQRISGALDQLGLPHRTGLCGTGIVADLEGRAPGPRVALRADTDALPITERTGLPFASVHDGVMHACGHDGHTAMLLGAAALLLEEPPPGPVRLIWQPAEERGDGARAMVEAGVLDGVAAIFGGHVDPRYDTGVLVVTEGAVNASTDTFRIRIVGRQGHGGRPHECVDAIAAGALVVGSLQTLVSRTADPGRPAVVSVGAFHAGSAPNVIAGEAVLDGTLRAHDEQTRALLREGLRRVVRATAEACGARGEVELHEGTPVLLNVPDMTSLARDAARQVVGAERVRPLASANMGGEDFAWYLQHVPGCYVRFGARPAGRDPVPAHSGGFDIDEGALTVGAAWLDRVARIAGERLQR